MAAYNRVNGTTMTESPLLGDGPWRGDALVMSDWGATRSTEARGQRGARPRDARPGLAVAATPWWTPCAPAA